MAAAAKAPRATVSLQPSEAARMMPYTSEAIPAVEVEVARLAAGPGEEERGGEDDQRADRHVDEQHPAPRHPLGDHPAEHQAQRSAAHDHGGVDAQRAGPLTAVGEAGGDHR